MNSDMGYKNKIGFKTKLVRMKNEYRTVITVSRIFERDL